MYRYPCPGCRSTNVLHGRECQFDHRSRTEIERVHVGIISVLSAGPASPSSLRDRSIGDWDDLHESTLRMLRRDARVELDAATADSGFELVPPDEIADRLEPTDDPLHTIYEHGSVPGSHDNSVFAMVSYYASKGLSWEDTKRQVVKWLRESGTWDRGGFEEPSPEVLVEDKRHVHREGYGWLEKAKAAKRVIDDSHLVDD